MPSSDAPPSGSAASTLRPAAALNNTWTDTLSSTQCNYRISVAIPQESAPPEGFPVLYLLDANAGFATVVETHRRLSRRPDATHVRPAVIVGIGHETDALYDTSLRQRDFGGGEDSARLLALIEEQVKPLIAQSAHINPQHQILLGHSLAAYFTLWVLRHQPSAFQSYVALSPSLWWDASLSQQISDMDLPEPPPRVFLAVGEWEEQLAPWQHGQAGSEVILQRRLQRRMVSNVQQLGIILQQRLGTERTQCTVFPQEDHASVFGIGISRAMRALL